MSSIALVGYAVLLAGPVAWALRRARWVSRTPALGVAAWHMLSVTVLVTALLGAFAAIPPARGGHHQHDHLAVVEACLVAAVFVGIGGASLARALASYVWRRLLQRRRHRRVLRLVGHQDPRLGAVVVDHDSAVAYCVPGPGGQVVLTTAAVAALDDTGLAAVLAHERAHLRGRHDLLLASGRVLRAAFPFVPAFRWACDELGGLVELLADDAAARRCGRRALAAALVVLAANSRSITPPIALPAGGTAASTRVKRLLDPDRRLGPRGVAASLVALVGLLAMPVYLAAPALAGAADILSHCPFG